MNATTSAVSKQAFRLEVLSPDDDGIRFDVDPHCTVYELMDLICENWLDDFREGDGRIDDHLWKVFRPRKEYPVPPRHRRLQRMHFDEESGDEDDDDYLDEDEADEYGCLEEEEEEEVDLNWDQGMTEEEADRAFQEAQDDYFDRAVEADNGIPRNKHLDSLSWFVPGVNVNVEYDFCRETNFQIHFISIQQVEDSLPNILPSKAQEAAKTFITYTPPPSDGLKTVDEIYPHANDIMFASRKARWVCPYPTSTTSAGFVEGGRESGSDLVFLAVPSFTGLHEALVAIDQGMKKYPQPSGVSRMIFPIKMDEVNEERFQDLEKACEEFIEFKKTHDLMEYCGPRGINFEKFDKLPENIQYQLMCPDMRAVLRLTYNDMKDYEDVIQETFPHCCKAYKKGLWASYRRGTVLIAKGHDSGERGIPKEILAQVAQPNLASLHDFFCVCEALFIQVEADSKYHSLQKIVGMEPGFVASRK